MADERPTDDIDLRALRTFLAVYEVGNMTQAASDLGVTQSAVSQTVNKLEKALDATLFDRTQRPMQVTSAGEAFADRARELLGHMDSLLSDVREAGRSSRPRVRLGLMDSAAGTMGAALTRAIRSQAREVSVWSGISPNLRQDLNRGKLDLVITSDPTMGGSVKKTRLLREPFIAVLPKSFKRPPDVVDPMQLSSLLPLVRYSVRSVIGEEIERELVRRGQVPPRVFEFDGTDGVFAMVGAGLGWAITTPLCLVHGKSQNIRAVRLNGVGFSRDVHLLAANAVGQSLQDNVKSAALGILTDLVQNQITALAPTAVPDIRIG